MAKRSGWYGRGSRQSRGYGAEWDRIRLTILERDHHLCQCDLCRGGDGRVTLATHVDHKLPKAQGGTDHPSNLRSLNVNCHQRITAEQQGHHVVMGCDAKGNPLDPRHPWAVGSGG